MTQSNVGPPIKYIFFSMNGNSRKRKNEENGDLPDSKKVATSDLSRPAPFSNEINSKIKNFKRLSKEEAASPDCPRSV